MNKNMSHENSEQPAEESEPRIPTLKELITKNNEILGHLSAANAYLSDRLDSKPRLDMRVAKLKIADALKAAEALQKGIKANMDKISVDE